MKHNILWGIILLVASLSFTAKAQKAVQGQFSVKGVLLDSLSNEGEPYSTIRISLKNNPAKPVKLAVTGADGRFDERLAVPGTYLIHFTSVGKSPVQKEFSISANRRNVDLGKILIAEATEMLKGVEVVAQKPLVKAEIGLSGNFWLLSFKISYLCLPLFYETRTTPSCHPSGCAYRQL